VCWSVRCGCVGKLGVVVLVSGMGLCWLVRCGCVGLWGVVVLVSGVWLCVAAKNRDLVAQTLSFLAGSTLTTQRPNAFLLQFTLTGDAIPPVVGIPPVSPFTVAFFASDDAELSWDDVRLDYSLTESTAGMLQKGITSDSPVTLKDVTSGLLSIYFDI